jgi:hypothetical protein
MAAKFYCDVCETELKPEDHGRIKRQLGRVRIEIMRAVDNTWNGGYTCHRCVLDVVKGGEPFDT